MNFFKKIWNFLKSPKVKLWLIIMGIVVFVSVSVMSIIMIASPVEYSRHLRPYRDDVYTVSVVNQHFRSTPKVLNNNQIGGELDPDFNKEEGIAIEEILKNLHSASKTTRFAQFFFGEASGSDTVKYNPAVYQSSLNTLANGTYVLITFASPVYVLMGSNNSSDQYYAEKYDPEFLNNTASVPSTTTYHGSRVVHSIFIPLGSVKNNFAQHTWYIRTGDSKMNYNTSSAYNYTYTTYANYNKLFNYVNGLSNSSF